MVKTSSRILLPGLVVAFLAVTPAILAQSFSPSDESRSISLVNGARSQEGLRGVSQNSGLESVARAQAARMAERGSIYHNPNLESDADAAGVDWTSIGENVGVGYDIEELHNGFMNSPGHHENIVYPKYNALGVGVVKGDDGRMYVAQVYAAVGSAPSPAAPAPAPAQAASAPAATSSAPQSTTEVLSTSTASAPATASTTPSETHQPAPNVVEGGVVDLGLVF